MLSGFSKYLFGDEKQQNDRNTQKTPSSAGSQRKVDDWLLVDSEGNAVSVQEEVLTQSVADGCEAKVCEGAGGESDSTMSHSESSSHYSHVRSDEVVEYSDCESSTTTESSFRSEDCLRFRDGPRVIIQDWESHSDAGLSDVSSQPEIIVHPSINDCWFITPPPCFVGRQAPSGDQLVSNPLENLLIEHPSMSVYVPRRCISMAEYISPMYDIEDSVYDDSTEVQDENMDGKEHNRNENTTSSVASRVNARNQAPAFRRSFADDAASHGGNAFRAATSRDAQQDEWKGKMLSEYRCISRNAFNQRNRVAERGTKSKPIPGKFRIMQPSGKKYNRKC